MLKAQKRHCNGCRYSQYDRGHTKCTCPYHAIGVLNGVFIRKSLKTSNYETATRVIRNWESAGSARDSGSQATFWEPPLRTRSFGRRDFHATRTISSNLSRKPAFIGCISGQVC